MYVLFLNVKASNFYLMKNAGILKAYFFVVFKLFSLHIWENGCVFKCMLKQPSENELLTYKCIHSEACSAYIYLIQLPAFAILIIAISQITISSLLRLFRAALGEVYSSWQKHVRNNSACVSVSRVSLAFRKKIYWRVWPAPHQWREERPSSDSTTSSRLKVWHSFTSKSLVHLTPFILITVCFICSFRRQRLHC